MRFPALLSSLVLLALLGCATTHQIIEEIPWQEVKAQIPPNSSLVYVVRPLRAAGSANRYKISINGKYVADIATKEYFSYLVPFGDVLVSAETVPNILNIGLGLAFMGKPKLSITARPGEIYFVNVGVDHAGGPTLTSIEPQAGMSLIKETKRVGTLSGEGGNPTDQYGKGSYVLPAQK